MLCVFLRCFLFLWFNRLTSLPFRLHQQDVQAGDQTGRNLHNVCCPNAKKNLCLIVKCWTCNVSTIALPMENGKHFQSLKKSHRLRICKDPKKPQEIVHCQPWIPQSHTNRKRAKDEINRSKACIDEKELRVECSCSSFIDRGGFYGSSDGNDGAVLQNDVMIHSQGTTS